MAYKWKPNECDPMTGRPYSKGPPPVRLEKDKKTRRFNSQVEIDQAWAQGWHEPGRPETKDMKDSEKFAVTASDIKKMDVSELLDTVDRYEIPDIDKRWGLTNLREKVLEFFGESK